jgi:hypothetical protein
MFKKAKGILFVHVLFALLLIPCGHALAVNSSYVEFQDGANGISVTHEYATPGYYLTATGSSSNAVYLCKNLIPIPPYTGTYKTVKYLSISSCGSGSLLGYHKGFSSQSYPVLGQFCLTNPSSWPSPTKVCNAIAFTASEILKRTTLPFGQLGNTSCTGRCGIGCTWMPYEAWTPECLVHDQCLQSTSTANPACWGPMFDVAATSYIFALDPVYNKVSNFIESFLSDLF